MARSDKASGTKKPSFASIVRISPTQQVREQLLEAIQRDDYGPGDALPSERLLCEMFGVSRVSVREAIAGLEAMGIVTVQHGRGCFVAEGVATRFSEPFGVWLDTHRDEMVNLLKVRGALDELAAAEAAESADAEALQRLASAHERFGAAISDDDTDLRALIELDVEFHGAVAQASGSELLYDLLRELAEHIADSRRVTFQSDGQPVRSLEEHAAIIAAIRAGDAQAARRAAADHVRGIRRLVDEDA